MCLRDLAAITLAAITLAAITTGVVAPVSSAGQLDRCEFRAAERLLIVRLAPGWSQTEIMERGSERRIEIAPRSAPNPECNGATVDDVDEIRIRGTGEDESVSITLAWGVAFDIDLLARRDSLTMAAAGMGVTVTGHQIDAVTSSVSFRSIRRLAFAEPTGLDASGVAPGVSISVDDGSGTIIGGPGNDRLRGSDGPDVLIGGRGNDVLSGEAGDDAIVGGPAADVVTELCECGELGDGADQLDGSGGGRDRLVYSYREAFDQVVSGVVVRNDGSACSGADVNADGDACDPSDERDSVEGFEVFWGGFGDDILLGEAGVDETFVPWWGTDTIVGNAGDRESLDVSNLDGGGTGVWVNLVDGVAEGHRGVAMLSPTDSFLRIIGSGSSDFLGGGGGVGRLYLSGAGADEVMAGAGDDVVKAGPQPDRVHGGAGDDRVVGGSGGDRLAGGTGADTAKGGRGHDRCRAERTIACEVDR